MSEAGPAPMQAMRLPFFCFGARGSTARHVVAMIGGDALQAADRDRLCFDASAAARRLARAIADAAENAGKDVRLTVDQVGLRELSLRDEPDVFGNVGMGRAGPLAIDYAMIVVRISSIGRFHRYLAPYTLVRVADMQGVGKPIPNG